MSAPGGPYDTERESRAAAHAVIAPEPGWSILRAGGFRVGHRL